MVGEFSVGKTSLTQKFVNNAFSEKYLTTVGVKIDTVDLDDVKLVVWDIAGRDSISPINLNYLVGAAGFVLVVDGTRQETLTSAADILKVVRGRLGNVPCLVALNKSDSVDWSVSDEQLAKLKSLDVELIKTSAKEGTNVSDMFKRLAEKL